LYSFTYLLEEIDEFYDLILQKQQKYGCFHPFERGFFSRSLQILKQNLQSPFWSATMLPAQKERSDFHEQTTAQRGTARFETGKEKLQE
jgi:hypothetical protein